VGSNALVLAWSECQRLAVSRFGFVGLGGLVVVVGQDTVQGPKLCSFVLLVFASFRFDTWLQVRQLKQNK